MLVASNGEQSTAEIEKVQEGKNVEDRETKRVCVCVYLCVYCVDMAAWLCVLMCVGLCLCLSLDVCINQRKMTQ